MYSLGKIKQNARWKNATQKLFKNVALLIYKCFIYIYIYIYIFMYIDIDINVDLDI